MNDAPVYWASDHPLAQTFSGPGDRVFLEDDRQTWTVERLLSLAGDIVAAVPAGPVRVAVRSRSAAFVVASLVGLWKARRHPLLLDPTLSNGATELGHLDPGMPVLVPGWEQPAPGEVAVAESGRGGFRASLPPERDIVVAFFTSGSTGEPKIVEKRDYQFRRQFEVEPAWYGLAGPVRTVSLVPSHHILGYIYGIYLPAATGGRVAFLPGSPPQRWIDTVHRQRPSLVVGVPLHYRLINQALNEPLPKALYLSSGGPVPANVAAAFHRRAGWPITQVYGSTEAAGIATCVGSGPFQPLPGVEWQVQPDDGRLLIRSPWQDGADLWHCQDDVVEPSGDGFEIVGRADSVVKVGGRRFSLAETVKAALSWAAVDQAAAVPYERYGELAVALFVVPAKGRALAVADVRAYLTTKLAPFKVPRTIWILDELPSRGIGKIDDEALRQIAGRDTA